MNATNGTYTPRYWYIALFGNKRLEVYAESSYAAHVKAVAHFKPAKSKRHLVSVTLAEIGGETVTHTADT